METNKRVGAEGVGQYSGPAPEPQRKIDLTGNTPDSALLHPDTLEPTNAPGNSEVFDPSVQTAEAPQIQSSPPPVQPEDAVQIAEYKHRLGQATNKIGQLEAEKAQRDDTLNRKLEEMRLHMDVALASQQQVPQNGQTGQLPAGINPEDTPTWGQMNQLMSNLPSIVAAQALRATWDVQPQEEQAAYAANPAFANLPEPQRSKLIQRQVALMRQQAGPAAATPSQAQAPEVTPQPQRPVAYSPPFVEGTQGSPALPEPQIEGDNTKLVSAKREYQAAMKIENPRERKRAMRIAWEKCCAADGVSLDALAGQSFKVGEGLKGG